MEENQVYSDNIGKLYRDAVSRGMKADEQTFRNYLSESDENRRKVYNDLVARGMKADENQFFEYIGYPMQQPAQRVDVSDVEQGNVTDGTDRTQASTIPPVDGGIPTVTEAQVAEMDGQQHYQPRVGGEPMKTPEQLEAEAREMAGVKTPTDEESGEPFGTERQRFAPSWGFERSQRMQDQPPAQPAPKPAMRTVNGKTEYDFSPENLQGMKEFSEGAYIKAFDEVNALIPDIERSIRERALFDTEQNNRNKSASQDAIQYHADKLAEHRIKQFRDKIEKEGVAGFDAGQMTKYLAFDDEELRGKIEGAFVDKDESDRYMQAYHQSPEWKQEQLKGLEQTDAMLQGVKQQRKQNFWNTVGGMFGDLAISSAMAEGGMSQQDQRQLMKMQDDIRKKNSVNMAVNQQLHQAENTLGIARKNIEEGEGNMFVKLGRGVRYADLDNLIPVSELYGQMGILQLYDKLDENGNPKEQLTDDEQTLYNALAMNQYVQQLYGDKVNMLNRIGKGLPEQAMFTLSFLLGSEFAGAQTIGRGATKAMQRGISNIVKKEIKSGVGKFMLDKALPTAFGMGAETLYRTGLQTGNIVSGAIERHVGTVQIDPETGEIGGFKGGVDWGEAMWKSTLSVANENFTELLGDQVFEPGWGWLGRNTKAGQRIADFRKTIGEIGDGRVDDILKMGNDISQKAGWNGWAFETLEELAGNFNDAAFIHDHTWEEAFSKETVMETVLNCMVFGMVMGSSTTTTQALRNLPSTAATRNEKRKAAAIIAGMDGISTDEIDNHIDNDSSNGLADWLVERHKAGNSNGDWTDAQRAAVANYVRASVAQKAQRHFKGMQLQEDVQKMEADVDEMTNNRSGNVIDANFEIDGQKYTGKIIGGRVSSTESDVVDADGQPKKAYTYNPYLSSATLSVMIEGTGEKKMIPARAVTSINDITEAEQFKSERAAELAAAMQQSVAAMDEVTTVSDIWGVDLQGGVVLPYNGGFVRLDGKNADGNWVLTSLNPDGTPTEGTPPMVVGDFEFRKMGMIERMKAMQQQGASEEEIEDAVDDINTEQTIQNIEQSGNEDNIWDNIAGFMQGYTKTNEEGDFIPEETRPEAAAGYLVALQKGDIGKTIGIVDARIAELQTRLMAKPEQVENNGEGVVGMAANQSLADSTAEEIQKQIGFLEMVRNGLVAKQAEQAQMEAQKPVSQMEVGTEFPVMYDGQQAVAVVVGMDADGRNVVTIRDQEGNDLESGIDDWTDEQWERFKSRAEEVALPTQQTEQQESAEIEQKEPENEQQEEVSVSPAQQTFDGLVQKYGDKAGHKIDVTAEDKSKTLDKAKKALDKAQTDYDDAPIGKEEKAEAALQKAQEEYNTALAEKQEWNEVKSVKDRFVAERLAAQQAADEERHAQAVAEEEALRAEEERKAREREATGANNVAPNIREKWEGASKVEGNADEITLANGERIAGHYVLVESGAASASHDALNGFAKTEGFPLDENEQSVNDRDYERDKNAQQITRQIAAEYDSRALQQPVVVSQDGVVLSGNGRTMAGEIAAAQNTDGAYIDYLKKYAPKYGFTPEQVEGMSHPRVLFVPDASMPYTAETFAKFNQQEMKGQSKTEQAVKLGKLVDDATFGRIIRSINRFDTLGDFYADTKATAEAIGELLKTGAINQMQRAEMFDGDAISAQGREILENMLIGKAFESNPDAVRQLQAYKSLRQSVITALAEISNNIALGEYSLESELSEAIALAYNARKNGYKAGDAVSEFARQGKLFETEEDATAADYTNATVLMLADVMNDNRVTRLKKVLSIYNQQAEQSAAGQTDLFAEGVKTQQEILNEVLLLLQHGTESEQQQALDEAVEQRKAAAEQGTGIEETGDTGESDAGERGAVEQPQPEKTYDELLQEAEEEIADITKGLSNGLMVSEEESAIIQQVADMYEEAESALTNDIWLSEQARLWLKAKMEAADKWLDENVRGGEAEVVEQENTEPNKLITNEEQKNSIEDAKKVWENLCNPKEITNFASDSQKQAEWVDAHLAEIVEAYIAANGNKLDPDEVRKCFTGLGYDGKNVGLFKEQTDIICDILFERMLKDAVESGKPSVTFLTGVGGAGKSTATSKMDMSSRGLVYDSSFNEYKKLKNVIEKAKKAGITNEDIQVVAVHNDAVTAFNNTLNRGRRIGRFLPLEYFFRAFQKNQGKIKELHDNKNFSKVNIICFDNSGNQDRGAVELEEAFTWDYAINDDLCSTLLDILENGINEGRFTEDEIASLGYRLPEIVWSRGSRAAELDERISRIVERIQQTGEQVLLHDVQELVHGRNVPGTSSDDNNGERGRDTRPEGPGSGTEGVVETPPQTGGASEAGEDAGRGSVAGNGYTITPAQYTTKKGKVLDMHLVKFDKELTKEQQRAANALARDLKGWWSREDGGFMMRDEATAQQLIDAVMEESGETLQEAAPLSLADLRGETEQPKPTDEAVAAANEEVDTNPTEAQKEAGNYKKGHVTIDGFDISIENPAGSTRSGTDAQGNPWSVTMHNSYGYIRMTEGVDGDHIDIFLSDHIDDWNGTVYVVDQVKEDGSFDEHKVMYGFNSAEEAREAYLSNYSEGWQGLGTITGVSREEFKKWVDSSHRKTKAFADYKSVQTTEGQNEGPKQVSVEGLIGDLYSKGEAKLSDHVVEEAAMESRTEGTEQQPTTSTYGASNKIVSQSRYEELKRRMQEKLGGQMNMGIDPEILAIGTEMAVYHIEAGARKFADFCKNMVADLGDAIRPYLKSFYNAVRDLPEVEEAGYLDELTPYEEVKSFDVNGFDKGGSTFVETAQEAVKENEVAQQAEEATEKLKQQRKERKQPQQKKKVVSSQPSLFGEETEIETKPQDDGIQRNDVGSSEGLPAHSNQSAINPEGLGETEREEGGRADRGGQRDSSPVTGRPAGRVQELRNTHNNHAERGTDYAPKGVDARIEANIKAIELMQQLIESGEQATPEQMAVLRQFSGWGGLGKAFQETGIGYGYDPAATSKRLRALLGDEAYEQANMSRNSAYYTPAEVIDTLWDIARAMGFKGGNVLEGSAGIGNIIGLMPTDMSQQSSIHAVEIDQTTGNILSLLYPDAKVEVQGFEATQVENGSVDLAITNVPFVTGLRVNDTTGDKDLSRRFHDIHDFCIAKNIRKLREGGIGIFITSSGTLDNSAKLREWIVNEGGADVVGAFRMNNATFGGTGVTSDIIVVRKRVNGKKSQHAIDVAAISGERVAEYDTGETKKVKGQEVRVVKQLSMDYNKYFIEHPEMMAGEMQFGFERGETFRPTSKALYPTKDKDQSQMLADFVRSFEGKEWEAALATQQTEQANVYEELGADVKEGSMLVNKDGVLCVAQRGKAVPLEVNANKVKGHTKVECFNAYQAIKQALADVLSYQTENESDDGLQPLLDKLNKAFDSFVKTYGNLHKNTAITFLKSDVDWPNILALEKYSESNNAKGERVQSFGKTDIFSKRVVEKEKEPEPKNVKDGIIASIYMFGRVDVPYISEHLGMSEEEVREEIVKEGLGFENPATRQMEVIYEYLSGNVREKLQQARDNNADGRYNANIKALERVIPMDIPAHLIDFTIGSSWIDPKLYEEFVKERTDIDVKFTAVGGTWFMKAPSWVNAEKNRAMGVVSEMLHKTIMGTQLIEAAMQNKTITVSETRKKYDGTTETTIDKEATQACAAKIDEIRQDFKDWARAKMQSDPEMSERMGHVYNELFNNYVPKEIPEEFAPLRFSGMASVVKGKPFSMNPHQAKAAIRATTQPLLLAHEVGSGKTITLIATAMEMRRLGTAKKPMIVVQNSTVGQFVESAKQLYPNAKVLTIEEADRTVEGRKNFYAKIKYNDWDMIVVPQSVFERIPDSEERQMAYVQDKIEEKMMVLEQMRDADDSGNNMIVRQAEREISQLEDQLAGLSEAIAEKRKTRDAKKEAVTRQNAEVKALEMLDRQTDDVENFDDMGIDAILVDEAHEYKHLGFATAMQRGVKGVDPSYSKKAQGVFLKAQAVMEKNNGRNVVFATGTPISNTAAEIWTFMRYLMPADTMKQYGIYYFDDFVRNFGNLQQMLEFTTSGKFKENNRFAGYVNLPELVRIWSGVADTVLNKDIEEERKRRGGESKIPELEGGKAQDIYLPQTKALRAIMKYVKGELERFEQMSGKDKKANSHIPLVMYGIAKAAAVDARLVDETAEDDPNSKTNEAVRQTLRSLEETKDYRGTVAIFADNYQRVKTKTDENGNPIQAIDKKTGKPKYDKNGEPEYLSEVAFNIYEDIRKKLIEAGVPESEVVVMKSGMSDKKKLEIFDKVKKGEIRVILGSTFTLGTGVNIQDRLHTLIHLDAPNRPMDYTQRNGRILRQGNMHKVWGIPVRVLRFGVEDSLDVTAYQRLKTKGAIADSIMHGKDLMMNSMENRVMEEEEDVFGDTVAQLSGSEYAMLKNQAEKELRKLQAKRKQWEADQTYVHNQIPRLQGSIRAAQRRLEEEKGNLEKLSSIPERPTITIGKHTFKSLEDMADFIKEYNAELKQDEAYVRGNMSTGQKKERTMTVNVGGIDFKIHLVMSLESVRKGTTLSSVVKREMTYSCEELGLENVPVHQMLFRNALEDILTDVVTGVDSRDNIESAERIIERDSHELEQLKARDGKPFEFEKELQQARERLEEYTAAMKKEMEEKEAKYADMDSEVEAATGLTEAEEAEEEETPDLSISGEGIPYYRTDGISSLREEERIAFNAVMDALGNAGIEVVMATQEDVEKLKASIRSIQDSKGTVRGWVGNDGRIYLTSDGMSAETPIHEYTHLWAEALQMNNPELWEQIKGLLKDTPEWKRITSMKEYSNLKDEDRIAGEVLAHISGKRNAERMEAEAKRMIDEAPTLEEAAKAANLLGRMRDALKKFWTWVGKTLLGKKGNINIDQVSNMVLADLTNGIDPFNPRGGKRTNRTKRTDASISERDAYNGKSSQERSDMQYEKASEILKALYDAGYKDFFISRSITDFGVSTYIQGMYGLKFRISDHSVTSNRRIMEEHFFTLNTPANSILDIVKEREEIGKVWAKKFDERKEKERLLDEKWERIKPLFEGLGWKRNDRTYQNFEKFSSNERRSNILQTPISGGAFMYEWTEPIDAYTREKPSYEWLEHFDENDNVIQTTRLYAEGEMERIKREAQANGTFMKAPNGKPTKLTERQWLQVRSEAFKKWFGDWENDPENASKVVDKNGEPMVVYHGTHRSPDKWNSETEKFEPLTEQELQELPFNIFETNGEGVFFADKKALGKRYSERNKGTYLPFIFECFLNIRNPEQISAGEESATLNSDGTGWRGADNILYMRGKRNGGRDKTREEAIQEGYDGFFLNNHSWEDRLENYKQYVAFNPNQIKSATENNGEFDSGNDDIRFSITGPDNAIAGEYNRMTGYNSEDVSGYVRVREELLRSFFDGLRPLEQMQQLVEKALGRKLRDSENAYGLATLLPSLNKAMMDKAETEFMLPVLRQSANMMRRLIGRRGHRKMSREEAREMLNNYLLAKHGLERNEWFFEGAKADYEVRMRKLYGKYLLEREEKEQASENRLREKYAQYLKDNEDTDFMLFEEWLEEHKSARELKKLPYEEWLDKHQHTLYKSYLRRIKKQNEENKKKAKEDEEVKEIEPMSFEDYKKTITPQLQDKSGLIGLAESLGENPDDYKAVAEQVVADFEDMFDATEIDDYWASMKALTDRMLEISFESGMIDKDTFESLKARHKYYVPLRGFADGTSGDLFDYVSRHPHFQSVFQKAKGRKSKADDPLANLYNMLQSAIVIGNNNKVMQNIYNLAVNSKSDLLRVNRSWYVKNAKGDWEERFPDIPEDATADEIDAIMKQFDADMQALKQQGKAKQLLNKMELQKKVLPYQAKEHEMTAYVNGRKVVMHVAGNPLVAQQLNKANTQQLGAFAETVQGLTRFASMINTSLSPAFMFTNAARDIGFSLFSATVTGGLKKNVKMVGNLFRAGWVLPRLILTGKMGSGITKMFSPTEAAKIEQWWNEFLDNGGETGFTNTLSAEKAKGQVDDMLRRMVNYRSKDGKSRLKKATLGVIETMGRYSEDISRFAAYCLKRSEGDTVKASVNEAKNVTVNFNVKGGGNSLVARFVAGCRSCYSFFNAALQGINRMARLAKENPWAFGTCLLACVLQGAMLPWLNIALFALLGGDDDDWEKYEMLSEYTANHNLIIFVGNHKFLKIPYSQELAPFAAMGNIWFRQQMGWNHGRSVASQIGNMFLDLAPVNIGESKTTMGKLAKTATPTILMPVTEWMLNENFTAAPIEKRYEWNKFDSGWEKAYESRTSKWLIDATRYLDEKTNGKIDINPSFVEHIATGMLGGIGRSGDNLMKYFSDGFQTQNAPYLRTIMFDSKQQGYIGAVSREYGRLAYEVLPEVKHDVDRADMLEFARLANTQDYQIANVVSIYKTGKDLLGNKSSFQGIDKLEKEFKKAEKAAMESPDNRTEQVDEYLEAMRAQINEMKMEMLDAVDEVIYNNSGDGRKGRIDRVREIREESKAKAEGKKE